MTKIKKGKIKIKKGKIKKGIGGILPMGLIQMTLAVTPEGAEFVFECAPIEPLVGTAFEDLLITTTKNLTAKVREWEKEESTATDIKAAALIHFGFV